MFSYNVLCVNYFLSYQPFLVVEVAPRHADYWNSLGFVALKDATWCDRVNTASALLGCDWVRLWHFIKIEWENPIRGNPLSNPTPIAIRRFVRHFMPWENVNGIMHRMTLSQKKIANSN
jgi:hypothetical protein